MVNYQLSIMNDELLIQEKPIYQISAGTMITMRHGRTIIMLDAETLADYLGIENYLNLILDMVDADEETADWYGRMIVECNMMRTDEDEVRYTKDEVRMELEKMRESLNLSENQNQNQKSDC
jgi:hypothetical protein